MTACVGPAWCSASPQRGSTRSSTRSRCPAWHRRPPEPLGGAHPPRDWTAGQARTDTDAMRRLLARLLQPLEATVVLVFYRSEEHTSELQSLMRISYAVFCLKKKNTHNRIIK